MTSLSVGFEGVEQKAQAEALAQRLGLPMDHHEISQRLVLTSDGLVLSIPPFLPLRANFQNEVWQKRRLEGKKQGVVKACKPAPGIRIIDATAGWGRDAAILASYGAQVLMLERNRIMAALLDDALQRRDDQSKAALKLSLIDQDALVYLNQLPPENYPDIIYLDPMHPQRQKTALVKKDLQVLQHMIGPDEDALALIQLARTRVLKKVVVKWPQNVPALLKPCSSISGKTVRFDSYTAYP
jgi:16S rRNA (guanine1516-N2)-methyltransferase